jgi:hypothetical protein
MTKPLFLLALALLPAPAQEPSAPATPSPIPTQLIITYRCPPPRRAAFRQYLTQFGIARFERWKQDGVLSGYQLMFNWYADVDTWDAMAILSLPDAQQLARWNEIEKANPGGLARDALEMAWPLNTYSADLLTRAAADTPQDPARSAFLVIPYDSPGEDFREYANSYLLPQVKGSLREGVLAGYSVFTNRYSGGKRWQGLVVLEYKDVDSLSRREEVNNRIRMQLRGDPAWRAAGEKHKSVTEREPSLAAAVLPH